MVVVVGLVRAEGRKEAEMEPGRRKKTRKKERKIASKEEEGKGSCALHVASPKIGKVPILIPEVFMTSNFYLQKFFNYKIIHTHQ